MTGCLGSDTFAAVEAKHPRQITITLLSRTFSRSHHSVLLGLGSGASSSFGTGLTTDARSEDLWDLVCRKDVLFPGHIATSDRMSE